ncbi:unnamed protein product [Linum trigynum]|uniref:Uncharacterized protein n=1 Tax=Linum trigynum TaxID=586398 RepID=A0AAV2DBZ2_9ROSI
MFSSLCMINAIFKECGIIMVAFLLLPSHVPMFVLLFTSCLATPYLASNIVYGWVLIFLACILLGASFGGVRDQREGGTSIYREWKLSNRWSHPLYVKDEEI